MPAGICGLVIAGIFAAAMSSLDSAMHSSSTAIVTDFYRRFRPNSSEELNLKIARWITALLGIFAIVAAVFMAVAKVPSLWDLFMKLLGFLGGGITGIFLLGILTHRTNGIGALAGALVSSVLVLAAQNYTEMHFFLYGAVGVISAMVVGYLVSMIIPEKPKNLKGLTIYTMEKR